MNWWKRFKINWAKKILNDNAPAGEFIAYINKDEERKLKKLGGLGKPVNETGIKSFLSLGDFNPVKILTKAVKAIAPIAKFLNKYSSWITAINIGIMVISWLRKPDTPDTPNMDNIIEQQAKGVLVNKTSANAPIPVIYGQRKVGGVGVFIETSGTDNEYLYMIFTLAEGICNSCEKLYVYDKEVTLSGALTHGVTRTVASSDSNFYKADPTDESSSAESLMSVTWYDGRDDQTYDTTVGALSNWTSNHRLRGVSYLAMKFKWNQDAYMGIPNINALIKGRKVYNPNLDGTKTGGSGSHREDTISTW